MLVEGTPRFLLASDHSYLYRNMEKHMNTFSPADDAKNIKNQERMIRLAGSLDRVISRHDALQFEKYPTHGRAPRFVSDAKST